MSLVSRIRETYEHSPRRKPGTGNPTGSRFGTCSAQLQMLRFPALTNPEPFLPRSLMTFEEGYRTEEWLHERIKAALPGVLPIRQEVFYFAIPLAGEDEVRHLSTAILRHVSNCGLCHEVHARAVDDGVCAGPFAECPNCRTLHRSECLPAADVNAPEPLWGRVIAGFRPPAIRLDDDGRIKIRPALNAEGAVDRHMGFVLDPLLMAVWAPTYIDFAFNHPELGLVVAEAKSMSNYAFRRAMLGELDYSKRCQLVGFAESTGAHVMLIGYRKETAHLAEIIYHRTAERVRVTLTAPNGSQEVFFVTPQHDKLLTADGVTRDLPADLLWDSAEVWTPYDPALVEAIRARVRRVLLAAPGQWFREYGPRFDCQTCRGKKTITCKNCLGTGVGKTSTTGKKCGRCTPEGKGAVPALTQPCDECEGLGGHEEVELPNFPCGYCSTVATCYPFARLEITDKPRRFVTRQAWQEAGLTFTPPEGPPPPGLPAVEPAAQMVLAESA